MSEGRSGERLEPGSLFGRYRVIRRIGDGGMATIYLAQSTGPDGFSKPCALKLLRPEFSARAEINQMLVQEAKLSGVLNHANIVQVFDFGKVGSDYYLAMEWVDGATLSHTMVEAVRMGAPLSIGTSVEIAFSIGEALAYLQNSVQIDGQNVNLVHRDVSPSNVLISASGAVKLTDFGIAKILESPTETRVGVVKGKYAYMSPEQIRGDPVDHRSDIFALGIILFELLTRQRLFRRKTLPATVAAVHAARVPVPSSINPAISPALDAIVLRALAKRPADRYGSARELVADLWPIVRSNPERAEAELTRVLEQMTARAKLSAPVAATDPQLDADDSAVSASADLLAVPDSSGEGTSDLDELEELAGDAIDIADEGQFEEAAAAGKWVDSGATSGATSVPPYIAAHAFDTSDAFHIPRSAPPPAPYATPDEVPSIAPPPAEYVAAFDHVSEIEPPRDRPVPPEVGDHRRTYAALAFGLAASVIFWVIVVSLYP